jgi:hypothetical protein
MKRCDEHVNSYSSEFSVVNFLSHLNPLGAAYFCVFLFKAFYHGTTMAVQSFHKNLSKIFSRRMGIVRKGFAC